VIALGGALFVIGIGSFLLPLVGYQFTLLSLFEDYQPWVGLGLAVVGAALAIYGGARRQASRRDAQASDTTDPAPGSRPWE
jgi:hypothetical protein